MFSNSIILSKCGKKICNGNENDCPGTSGKQVGDSFKQALEYCSFPIEEGRRTGQAFKPSAAKRAEKEARINSGIVTMKDGNLSVKRGVTLPVKSQ